MNELKVEFGHDYLYFKTPEKSAKKALGHFLRACEAAGLNMDNMKMTEAVLRDADGNDIDRAQEEAETKGCACAKGEGAPSHSGCMKCGGGHCRHDGNAAQSRIAVNQGKASAVFEAFECDASCEYSPDGICLIPLLKGRMPEITEDGCEDGRPIVN